MEVRILFSHSMHVSVSHVTCLQVPEEVRRWCWMPWSCSCRWIELPEEDLENKTLVLPKNGTCSSSLSHLQSSTLCFKTRTLIEFTDSLD